MHKVQEYKDSLKEKVEMYKEVIKQQAEKLILEEFPEKILYLNEILDQEEFRINSESSCDLSIPLPSFTPASENTNIPSNTDPGEPEAKKFKLQLEGTSSQSTSSEQSPQSIVNIPETESSNVRSSNTSVLRIQVIPCNEHICRIIDVVKPNAMALIKTTNLLKMWINILIPKIEDGNNFGVQIQTVILMEIRLVELEALSIIHKISAYFIKRAETVSMVLKYPDIEDYRLAVEEVDQKGHKTLALGLLQIRNHYLFLQEQILKNFDKLKTPRNSNLLSSCI